MRWAWLAAALLVPWAGCLDAPAADSLEAKEAYDLAQDGLGRFEVALFLGIGATDAAVDPAALEAPGVWGQVLAHFGAGADDGRPGDGRAAAWILTHFVWDRETDASGGLFTQVSADGGIERLFVPFPGPYRGAPGLGLADRGEGRQDAAGADPLAQRLDLAAAAFAAGRAPDEDGDTGVPTGPVLCGLGTDVAAWRLGSVDAVSAALRDPLLREHATLHPGGEYTYFYLPGLLVEPGCPGNLTDPGNHWSIQHTELGADRDAGLAEVVVQAETGHARPGTVRLLRPLLPVVVRGSIEVQDPLVVLPGDWHVETVAFDVPEGMQQLYVQVVRHRGPEGAMEEHTRLVGPDGHVVARHDFGTPLQRTSIEGPAAGTWVLEYRYRTAQPLGEHQVDYLARAL